MDPVIIRQTRTIHLDIAVCPLKRAALEMELEEFWKALTMIVRRREAQLRELYGVPMQVAAGRKPCGCGSDSE